MATKEPKRDDPHRQIIPIAEDPEMFIWLEALFHISVKKNEVGVPKEEPDTFPESIKLRAVSGVGLRDVGPPLKESPNWKPMQSPLPTREFIVELANTFYAAAQRESNVLGRHQRYGLFAYSSLKGANAYQRYLFAVDPVGKEYEKGKMPAASDDDDTHRDRLLSTALAHARWQQEQHNEAMGGVMRLQQDIIKQQADTIARQDAERRAWIIASEEALSRKEEREIAAEAARQKRQILGDMWMSAKGFLPVVTAYLTKGKVGVAEGIKSFANGLSDEKRMALFGLWEGGQCVKAGILDEEQSKLFAAIVDGKVDPSHIGEFVAGLRPDQLMAAQSVLAPHEIQALIGIARAANDTSNAANGAAP